MAFTRYLDLIGGWHQLAILFSFQISMAVNNSQTNFALQEIENPIRTVLKNQGDLLAHRTEKVRGKASFRADLVQRFSYTLRDLCLSLSLICLPRLHLIPRLAPSVVPKWLQKFQALHLLTMLSQREDCSPLALSEEEESFSYAYPSLDNRCLGLLGHLVPHLRLRITVLIISE